MVSPGIYIASNYATLYSRFNKILSNKKAIIHKTRGTCWLPYVGCPNTEGETPCGDEFPTNAEFPLEYSTMVE